MLFIYLFIAYFPAVWYVITLAKTKSNKIKSYYFYFKIVRLSFVNNYFFYPSFFFQYHL